MPPCCDTMDGPVVEAAKKAFEKENKILAKNFIIAPMYHKSFIQAFLEFFGVIRTKRVYELPDESDGFRILVDRLWPRGLSKDKALVDLWLKNIAPSDELRKWYSHDPEKWEEFKRRYFEELKQKRELVDLIIEKAKKDVVTFLYSTKETRFNNAAALKEYVETLSA